MGDVDVFVKIWSNNNWISKDGFLGIFKGALGFIRLIWDFKNRIKDRTFFFFSNWNEVEVSLSIIILFSNNDIFCLVLCSEYQQWAMRQE